MTTTDDDVRRGGLVPSTRSGPMTALSVRELVTELARAEDALRQCPGDPDPTAQVRLLMRELRRRRALMRLQLRLLDDEALPGEGTPGVALDG